MKNLNTESTYDLINKLAQREEIEPEKIIEIISNSLKEAYNNEKEKKTGGEIKVFFDTENKKFLAYKLYKIVDSINDNEKEMLIDDPRIEKSEKILNGYVYLNIDLKNLQEFTAHNVRKNVQKFIVELRKERQYKIFLPYKGEIVSGYIQSIQENFCIINLGKGHGYWDKKEWVSEDKNYLGKHLRFLLLEVKEKSDLKQLVLTRKGEDFARKIFEMEIPEIKEGLITIEKIIRIPGLISKVIVKSNKFRLDPVGTCIGKNGSRIKNILKEMRRERIDLVGWSENKRILIFNLFSPVEIISLVEKNEEDYIVIIPESRMSLALYGGGKIVQKIGDYLGINIHIKSFEKSQKESDIVVWNGNINFEDYEVRKNLINSKQKQKYLNDK